MKTLDVDMNEADDSDRYFVFRVLDAGVLRAPFEGELKDGEVVRIVNEPGGGFVVTGVLRFGAVDLRREDVWYVVPDWSTLERPE